MYLIFDNLNKYFKNEKIYIYYINKFKNIISNNLLLCFYVIKYDINNISNKYSYPYIFIYNLKFKKLFNIINLNKIYKKYNFKKYSILQMGRTDIPYGFVYNKQYNKLSSSVHMSSYLWWWIWTWQISSHFGKKIPKLMTFELGYSKLT